MKSLNTVTLLGNLTQNPEVKQSPAGQPVCTFGLATSRSWKDAKGEKQSQTEFHNLVAWGKVGEVCGKYLKKGEPVYVQGHLKTGSWEKPKGVKHYRTEVIVDEVILLAGKKSVEADRDVEAAVA